MGRKRTIEITVETERIIEIRFRGTETAAADDADETEPRGSIREDPRHPRHPRLTPIRKSMPDE
jgi:hypothetical protein